MIGFGHIEKLIRKGTHHDRSREGTEFVAQDAGFGRIGIRRGLRSASRWKDRCEIFRAVTGTDKAVHIVLATPFGLRPNLHSGLVQNVVTLADLFRDA